MNKLLYGAIFIIALIIHSQFLMSFKSSNIESPIYNAIKKYTDFEVQHNNNSIEGHTKISSDSKKRQ